MVYTDTFGRMQTSGSGIAVLQADETADDSDKTLTVPANTQWEVLSVWVELITTATAGARQIEVQFRDGAADVIMGMRAGATQIASLTRNYLFAPFMPDLAAFRDGDLLTTPIPQMIIPATFDIRIFDNAAIDVAADDMVVQVMVQSVQSQK